MELEALASYLFDHINDEQPDHLVAGLINLETWMEANYVEANEGYRVDDLPLDVVVDLEGQTPTSMEGQLGAAVAYEIPYPMDEVMHVNLAVSSMEVNPDQYLEYSEEWTTDLDCFLAKECLFAEVITETLSNFPLNLEVFTRNVNQHRWVELPDGRMAEVRRNWMVEPGLANVDWINIEQQYFFAAVFPKDGVTRRVDAGWVLIELFSAPIPENLGVQIAVDSMKKNGETITAYLDAQ